MPKPAKLSPAAEAMAVWLQEAALELSHDDIRRALSDCLNDTYPGRYCYIDNVYGDAESGDVVWCCGGQYYRAPYELGTVNGKRTHSIDTEAAQNVLPRTVYDQEADDDDQYAGAMEAARKDEFTERFPGSENWKHRPLSERFISKKSRDAADAGDFAGNYDGSPNKKSFPILSAADVGAAVRSIGRGVAGGHSATSLKNRIKSIAKRKGFEGSLPDAWKSDKSDDKESRQWKPDGVLLVESAARFLDAPQLKEAASADYPIKLISPGRGSSGYYPPETLKSAAEARVFKAGTQMFWNHDTDAEEGARPEGDLNRLAAVTTTDAVWDEAGRDGPGLYARAKVFSDYADQVREKGPHIGLSIRAGGTREDGAKGPDGKPGVITALRNALSVDFVTRAGRDGKIFSEAASLTEGDDMTKEEIQAIVAGAVKEAVTPLQQENQRLRESMLLREQGPQAIQECLAKIRMPGTVQAVQAIEAHITRALLPSIPFKEGKIDSEKLQQMVEAEALDRAQLLQSMGYGIDVAQIGKRLTEAEIKEQMVASGKAHQERFDESMADLADIFIGPKLVKGGVEESARQQRKRARKAFIEGRAA